MVRKPGNWIRQVLYGLYIQIGGYLLHSGSPYILWSAPSVSAKHFTMELYGAGPTATACCARRKKSFPRLRESVD